MSDQEGKEEGGVPLAEGQGRYLIDATERQDRTLLPRADGHFRVVEQWLKPGRTDPTAILRTFLVGARSAGADLKGSIGVEVKEIGPGDQTRLDQEESERLLAGDIRFDFSPPEIREEDFDPPRENILASRSFDIRDEKQAEETPFTRGKGEDDGRQDEEGHGGIQAGNAPLELRSEGNKP